MKPIICNEKIDRDFQVGREVVRALKNISMSVDRERLTILRGRSGSGKTTLINLMGALDAPTRGSIYFEGNEISSMIGKSRDEEITVVMTTHDPSMMELAHCVYTLEDGEIIDEQRR